MVKNYLRKMAATGCVIVFISHRLQEIYSLSRKVTVMRNGQVVNTHDISDNEDILIKEMIGDDVNLRRSDTAGKKIQKTKAGQPTVLLSLKNFSIPGFGKPFDMEIKKGEMIGIAGLQGQGQSQLMRTLFGVNTAITLTLEGKETKIDSPRQAIREGFAYLSGDRKKRRSLLWLVYL
jgi:ABC-type sugar transport system ATPase subunit